MRLFPKNILIEEQIVDVSLIFKKPCVDIEASP